QEHLQRLMVKASFLDPQVLQSYLIKPIQRLCKYPLLLREAIKLSAPDAPDLREMQDGLDAVSRAAKRVNERQRQVENDAEADDFLGRFSELRVGNNAMAKSEVGRLLHFDRLKVTSG